ILFLLRALEATEDRGSRMEDRGWKIEDGGSRIESWRAQETRTGFTISKSPSLAVDPRSSILDLPSSILDSRSSGWLWWLAALLCVAGGVLTKWTAPAFFYGTAIPLLWLRGRLRLLWGWPHLTSVVLAGGVCFAWIVAAVALAGWQPFSRTVSQEALMR